MAKRNHHFVPQFYLRKFGINKRQINLYNLAKKEIINSASIKGQCSRRNFYGEVEDIENWIEKLENKIAPIINAIISSNQLPPKSDLEKINLIFLFIALQWSRTQKKEISTNATNSATLMSLARRTAILNNDHELLKASTDKNIKFTQQHAVYWTLERLYEVCYMISDLGLKLITTDELNFITSDEPVSLYNIFNENSNLGTIGLVQRGLLIFLPLSPMHVLIAYDQKIYKFQKQIAPTENDINKINSFQYINCHSNIYFHSLYGIEYFNMIRSKFKHQRKQNRIVIREYEANEFDSQNPSNYKNFLVHYHCMPNLKLNLSFLSLIRRVKRIPKNERIDMIRHNFKDVIDSIDDETNFIKEKLYRLNESFQLKQDQFQRLKVIHEHIISPEIL